ncbi:translation factor GTPase family protein [Konateibacter massiliensis]|uniref:translation factor GTPase family protein n=1 Tax=Konateibacter massiliensis TaxID=2002841 RepID=UPI000C156625|nr:TetM/TetW/TetO/TetS family tetracycline resistance ribosomal protection protein [Konateibacter massiliensis]
MRNLVIGILAHVDAGKTTLSESMLYLSGKIGKLGRVDNKDAYLDNYELERARGITIFSKQAMLEMGDIQVTLLDTPGHVDFSAEMERTLQVLDYAILVISGADGVQGHTKTLWRLLRFYEIPVFLFVNKMDQNGTDKEELMQDLRKQLDDNCVEFGSDKTEAFYEQLAMCDEEIMETFLETGRIETLHIQKAIIERKIFPCFFGSALKLDGVDNFMKGIEEYAAAPSYPKEFGARVYKIGRDEQGNRLTYMKLTGGKLKVKDSLKGNGWEDKVNQIRLYSGQKFTAVNEIEAGLVCAVTGLGSTRAGEGLGMEENADLPVLEPVLSYQILLPEGCDPRVMLPKLRQIEEEEPELHIAWDEELQEIQAQIMGEVQTEILKSLIQSRFGIEVEFGAGRIVYKETIANTVEGVGHFEPLRHYAEVHLLLEPLEAGSGLEFKTRCSEDILGKSWQKLVLTHLQEKNHRGVLTGASITDMRITLVSGRAHNKHTEGGDFREATYRAVRQGLMEAESVLLEPYYAFQLELPKHLVGRAMTDIEKMHGISELAQTDGDMAVLTGSAPVSTMQNYQKEVIAYTQGMGRLFYSLKGYERCHNEAEVIESIGYDVLRDLQNPTGSVFCAHGAGFLVEWNEVKDYMHIESYFQLRQEAEPKQRIVSSAPEERWVTTEEIDQIINSTSFANQGRKSVLKKQRPARQSYYKSVSYTNQPKETKEEYLLVDGYNIVFAWEELQELAKDNMDAARTKLMDIMSNYQAIRKCHIIVVFDAYRVQNHAEETIRYHNVHMVYTKEAQTADQYIERFAHANQSKYKIEVATSDGLQQIIIRGAGASLMSARELKLEVERANERVQQAYQEKQPQMKERSYIFDSLSSEEKRRMDEMMREKEE